LVCAAFEADATAAEHQERARQSLGGVTALGPKQPAGLLVVVLCEHLAGAEPGRPFDRIPAPAFALIGLRDRVSPGGV
jgi:hypothetical protein